MSVAKEGPLTVATVNGPKSNPQWQSNNTAPHGQQQDDLTSLIASVHLPAVAEAAGVALTKRGNRYSGLCPFHDEKTPSFFVFQDTEKGRFKCWGCGESGDALDFVQKAYGLDFKDAMGQLGFTPSKMTPELSYTIQRNKQGAKLVSSFRKWIDRQLDIACFVIHTCNRMVQRIKSPNDVDAYGVFYHPLSVAEYRHQWLCEASDVELYRLFMEGGFYE